MVRLNRSFYRYLVFVLFAAFSLLVVHLSNEVLIRNGDEAVTNKYLFVQYGMLFAFGISFHLLLGAELWLRIRETFWTLLLSLLLVVGCYLLAINSVQLYTEASGYVNAALRMVLDDRVHLMVIVLAGYLFGFSFAEKRYR
ncbi:hypothetical protein [Paenibacillus radicis (ex Gao et al. 2016)]|uniref:Uncharacterized protein n=1 Tax=Paenibacillus radicis (ex Gao et al. 2016) TaxID=1737354 RepID=A0A917HPX3_9BACL|nr:hypothetical protein [Paenibacillus radicis (ex Gao et al. 2016)]GGG85262.1 hypothetical protein GCM10010918_49000 [Paenibacillus radicis (ex Gao et al. 2016)]